MAQDTHFNYPRRPGMKQKLSLLIIGNLMSLKQIFLSFIIIFSGLRLDEKLCSSAMADAKKLLDSEEVKGRVYHPM